MSSLVCIDGFMMFVVLVVFADKGTAVAEG
jgi:hypothetical protein